jgi:hypothetical protein
LLIIHIGTQKTGTSALQGYLSANSEALSAQGIRYLNAGRQWGNHSSHGELAQSVLGRADASVWDEVRRELRSSQSRIDLISAEGFWFCDPAALKAQVPDIEDVRLVVYLRRQDKYLQSLWKQAVTGGRKHDFTAWRERLPHRGDYFGTIERWADQFGPKSIIVRPYERNGVVNTIEDFCRILGASGLAEQANVGRNPSPRRELLHFIRAFNHLNVDVDRHQLFRALVFKDSEYVRSCDMLSHEEAAALLDSYADGNRQLIEKYYRDDSTALFPELAKAELSPAWDLTSDEFLKLTVDVLDVVVQFAASGCISLETAKARENRGDAKVGPLRTAKNAAQRALRKAARDARNGRELPRRGDSREPASTT